MRLTAAVIASSAPCLSPTLTDRDKQEEGFCPLRGEADAGLGALMSAVCTARPPEWAVILTTGRFSQQEGGKIGGNQLLTAG